MVQLTTMMISREVEQGRLVHALPAWRPTAEIVHAIFPSRRGLLPSVRALLDFLGSECERQRLEADGGTYG
ncbi:DNA-binding transcriptional LysR family regulator [Sphingomonas sp. SORGH_AS 879]|nr:LysR substrate-binding domain-containing protein [Sphingomonas sp. SORGH_AS_0879]MDQ1231541.1 DNA-binding transcriptional LysR family regulator [Sphingomonas sp. SORGH_AS_0879]